MCPLIGHKIPKKIGEGTCMATKRSEFDSGSVFHRQLDLFNPEKYQVDIHQVGVGATGSYNVLFLSSVGFDKVHVWDFDDVEIHNMGGQLYGPSHIDRPKVECIVELLENMKGAKLIAHPEKWEGQRLRGVVICGIDSMEGRKALWEHCKRRMIQVKMFVDTRIGAQNAMILSVIPSDPKSVARYEETLYTDKDAAPLPCTQRGVSDINGIVGGLVTRQVRQFLKEGESAVVPEIIYSARNATFMRLD